MRGKITGLIALLSLIFLITGIPSVKGVDTERDVDTLKAGEENEVSIELESKESEFDLIEIFPKNFEVKNKNGNYESYSKDVRNHEGREMVFHHYKFDNSDGVVEYDLEVNSEGSYEAYIITLNPNEFEREELNLDVKEKEDEKGSNSESSGNEVEEVNESESVNNSSKEADEVSPITGYAVKDNENENQASKELEELDKFSKVSLEIKNQLNFFFK